MKNNLVAKIKNKEDFKTEKFVYMAEVDAKGPGVFENGFPAMLTIVKDGVGYLVTKGGLIAI